MLFPAKPLRRGDREFAPLGPDLASLSGRCQMVVAEPDDAGCSNNDALDDIEDMTAPADSVRPPRGVARRVRRTKEAVEVPDATSLVPGVQSIYVKTYGCSHNHSDSEYMCGLLAQYGYTLVGEAQRQDADLWLINTCTVKNPSQEHMQTDIGRGQGLGKPVVVAGCVSQGDPELKALEGLSIVGVQQLERVVEVVQETLRGNTVQLLERRERPSLDLPKVRRNRYVEIIPCNTGCLGSCTYCKTVHARGRLGSYEPAALVSAGNPLQPCDRPPLTTRPPAAQGVAAALRPRRGRARGVAHLRGHRRLWARHRLLDAPHAQPPAGGATRRGHAPRRHDQPAVHARAPAGHLRAAAPPALLRIPARCASQRTATHRNTPRTATHDAPKHAPATGIPRAACAVSKSHPSCHTLPPQCRCSRARTRCSRRCGASTAWRTSCAWRTSSSPRCLTAPYSPLQLLAAPCSPLQPLTAPHSPCQPLTAPASPCQPLPVPSSPFQPHTTPYHPLPSLRFPSSRSPPTSSPASPERATKTIRRPCGWCASTSSPSSTSLSSTRAPARPRPRCDAWPRTSSRRAPLATCDM